MLIIGAVDCYPCRLTGAPLGAIGTLTIIGQMVRTLRYSALYSDGISAVNFALTLLKNCYYCDSQPSPTQRTYALNLKEKIYSVQACSGIFTLLKTRTSEALSDCSGALERQRGRFQNGQSNLKRTAHAFTIALCSDRTAVQSYQLVR